MDLVSKAVWTVNGERLKIYLDGKEKNVTTIFELHDPNMKSGVKKVLRGRQPNMFTIFYQSSHCIHFA